MDVYEGIDPLPVNDGGAVAPDDIVGRDAEIARLLSAVQPGFKGALLLGDRRIGKSTLFTAIEQPLRDVGHYVVRVSAETSDLDKFGRALGDAVLANRPAWNVEITGEGSVNLAVAKLTAGIKASRTPTPAATDLFTLCTRGKAGSDHYLVVFLIDEITILATSLAAEDRSVAIEFLRTLRRARQSSDRIVMFFAGSIGLHHAALDDTEVNDMVAVHVDVLNQDGAQELARRLLAGMNLEVTSLEDVVAQIVTLTSGFPYYIHSLAAALQVRRSRIEPVSAQDVTTVFEEAVDGWNIAHYDIRIDQYYGTDADLVRALLDHFAQADAPLSVEDLQLLPEVVDSVVSRTRLLNLLSRLEKDHYLRRVGNRNEMANDLIRWVWKRIRRLS